MFAKLFSHELRTMARSDLFLIGVIVLIFGVAGGLSSLDLPVLSGLAKAISLAAVFALIPVVLVWTATNYWQNMHGQRGYFTMALPATGGQLFATKVIYACVLGLLCAALTLPGLLFVLRDQGLTWQLVKDSISSANEFFGPVKVTAAVVLLVAGFISYIVQAAAVLTCSAHARFRRLGNSAPIIGLVLLYLLNQALSIVGFIFMPLSLDMTTGEVVPRFAAPEIWRAMQTNADPNLLGLGSLILIPISAVVLAWIAIRQISRHTSLV